jgi:hypothetical protein
MRCVGPLGRPSTYNESGDGLVVAVLVCVAIPAVPLGIFSFVRSRHGDEIFGLEWPPHELNRTDDYRLNQVAYPPFQPIELSLPRRCRPLRMSSSDRLRVTSGTRPQGEGVRHLAVRLYSSSMYVLVEVSSENRPGRRRYWKLAGSGPGSRLVSSFRNRTHRDGFRKSFGTTRSINVAVECRDG